jgi:hypothetical protein
MNHNNHQIAAHYYRQREAETMRQQRKQDEPEKKMEIVKKAEQGKTPVPDPVNSKPKNSLIQRIKNFVKHIKTTIHANR